MTKAKVVELKGNGAYGDQDAEELRQFIRGVIQDNALNVKQLSHAVDLARSTVTEFVNGSYPYPEEFAKRHRAQFEAVARRLEEKSSEVDIIEPEGGVFETRAYKRAFQVMDYCRTRGELGLVTGHAGVGKTTALKLYASRRSDTVLITANPTFGKIGCLKVLAERFGLDPHQQGMTILRQLGLELPISTSLLIVDEADLLGYPALEVLRALFDRCAGQVGMVLSGMQRLYRNMTTGTRGGQDLAQLYSRVAMYADLPMPSRKEVEAFVKNRHEGKAPKEVIDVLAQEAAMHGMRRLAKLLPGAIEVAKRNKVELSAEAVEAARDAFMMVV